MSANDMPKVKHNGWELNLPLWSRESIALSVTPPDYTWVLVWLYIS